MGCSAAFHACITIGFWNIDLWRFVMAKTTRIRAKTAPEFKRGVPETLNEETRAAIRRMRAREGLIKYDSLDDFREDMERL